VINDADNTGEVTFTNELEEEKWLDGTAEPQINVAGTPKTKVEGGNNG